MEQIPKISLSDPNFIWGLSFTNVLILDSRIVVFDTSFRTKQRITQCFDQEYKRIPRNEGKGSPSSPRLASSSPGPWNYLLAKQPAHLGELITSRLRFSWPGQAFKAPRGLFSYK